MIPFDNDSSQTDVTWSTICKRSGPHAMKRRITMKLLQQQRLAGYRVEMTLGHQNVTLELAQILKSIG
jgi:hypothetical protein